MIRALKIAGLGIALLVVLIVAVLGWVIGTQSGSRFALARVQGFLPEGIELGQATGRLSDRLELRDVRIRQQGLELAIERFWLEWSPGELLGTHLEVAELGATGIRYRALPSEQPEPPPGEPFTLPERVELPVSVAVHRVIVEDVTLHTAPDDPEAEPLLLEQLLLDEVSFADARLALQALQLDSPLLTAAGRLEATAADAYPLDVNLEWRLDPGGYAAVSGITSIGGNLVQQLTVEQQLAAPYLTGLTGTVSNLLSQDQPVALALRLNTGDIQLAALQDGLPAATVQLTARVEGPVDALVIEADMAGNDPQQRQFQAALAALVEGEAITLEQLTVRQPGRDGELSGSGTIALAGDTSADLTVNWQALQWPLTGDPAVASPRGALTFTGPLTDYRLSLDTRVEPLATPPVELSLTGTGSLQELAASLNAKMEQASVAGRVEVAWDPAIKGRAELTVDGLDPGIFAEQWPGAVDAALIAAVDMQGENLQVVVSRLTAQGRLRDQPLSLTAAGRYLQAEPQPTVVVEDLEASLGDTRLDADGRFAETADLRWELASEDLSSLLPDASGRLSGSGTVSGTLPQVSVAATLQARNLVYGDNGLERLDLTADVDLSGADESTLSLVADNASAAGTLVKRVSLQGSGRPAEHRLSLDVDAEQGRAELALTGRSEDPWGDNPIWQFTLSQGALAYQDLAPWQLAEPAVGQVAADRILVEQQCWRSAEAGLCLQARQDAQGIAADLRLDNLRFAYFAPFLPEGMSAEGSVNATARMSQPAGGVLTADADVQTTAGQVELPAIDTSADAEPPIIRLEPSSLSLHLDESAATGRVAVNLEHATLRMEASTSAALAGSGGTAQPTPPVTEQPLAGNVQIDVPTLAFMSDWMPDLEDVAGRISGDLQLAGTLGEPQLGGSLKVEDGAVTVPQTGITLSALQVSLQGLGREVALQAAAQSGGGSLALDGRMSLPGDVPTAALTIRGERFEVLNNDDAQVYLSPDLSVEAGAERITITGLVHVPEAEITPGSQAPSAVTVSDDQVLVSEEADTATEAGRELYAKVRLTLGDEVSFAGFGLTARFEGDLLINQEPETPTTATGELRIVDGEYRAYGQGLVIDEGRIYFAGGPVTQPALDIRAVRRPAEGILVGALVQGPLEEPTFELFSEPSMPQQEQLSWLVLGRSLNETPSGQESALSQAALAMGLKGGDFLARNIGDQVGLDQVGIETGSGEAGAPSDPSEAALVVGKYLSPKLYVSYGIGLFSPESVLEMQYELSRNWKLVTQSSGDATGADVLYTVEFGEN